MSEVTAGFTHLGAGPLRPESHDGLGDWSFSWSAVRFQLSHAYAALIIAAQFFPKFDPPAALLSTFAVYAVGFIAQARRRLPLLGHLGDRFDASAYLAGVILMMGLATAAIGLLPTHSAIGVGAPILSSSSGCCWRLLRCR